MRIAEDESPRSPGSPGRPGAAPVVAMVVGGASLLMPLFGTIVAVGVISLASRGDLTPEGRSLVRKAAIVTAGVALLHVLLFLLLSPGSVEIETSLR